MAIEIKIVFMGTSEFAKDILSALVDEKYDVAAVFSQPDKKSGRNKEISNSPVKKFCEENSLSIYQPDKLNDQVEQQIIQINPDIIVVAAYGKILPKRILDIPKNSSLNVHASVLPKYRGPSPIQNSLLNGDSEAGVTIMLMDEGVDTGDILTQRKIEIDLNDTVEMLTKKLSKAGAGLLVKTIPAWMNKEIKPKKQENSKASFCKLIKREDGHISWNEKAENIYNKFRAFHAWPGIFSFWDKNNSTIRIKLNKISLQMDDNMDSNFSDGEVFILNDKIGIQADQGKIILEEVQLEGKKSASIKEFVNGHPDFISSKLK